MKNEFRTIAKPTDGLYKEKGSKFLAYAYPVESEEEVASILSALKKRYYDARHHCYAYIIGLKDQRFRANDDGEPNHSAGDPILGQIRSHELTNTLVVVVRYFGGTKLGVGGLIHAYKTSSEDALSKVDVQVVYSQTLVELTFAYDETAAVERILADFDLEYRDKQYTDACRYILSVKDEDVPNLEEAFELLDAELKVQGAL
ncbi:YigZ family protein [Marinoscillum sp. MHG1-6]|uniref:IMPACT family protein n=1 Tax=Marinoscillum sp. MHG1-6 TaxID=2959627 RepID=UPI0021585D75|nr:YigZ family protein [Marinoscillum sp. MHG1-6]